MGSIQRSPPIKEDGSCSSPDIEGPEAEAELLVTTGTQPKSSFFLKMVRLLHKICSTHQFRNEQVRTYEYNIKSKMKLVIKK